MSANDHVGLGHKIKGFVKRTLGAAWGLMILMFVGVGLTLLIKGVLHFVFGMDVRGR